MSRVLLTRKYHFNAAHRLAHPRRDDAWNRRVYGKCSHPDGHGHNFELEVTVRGTPDEETGFVVPLELLDGVVEEAVLEPFDHHSLDATLKLEDAPVPTSEVFVVELWDRLAGRLAPALGDRAALWRLRLWETPRNLFEYRGAPVPGSGPGG